MIHLKSLLKIPRAIFNRRHKGDAKCVELVVFARSSDALDPSRWIPQSGFDY